MIAGVDSSHRSSAAMTLRQKGPLLKPTSFSSSSDGDRSLADGRQYDVKGSSGDETSFWPQKKSKKKQEQGEKKYSSSLWC